MISNLNRSTFMGHLGADAKQANGTAPVTFAIAVSSHWIDNAGDRQTRTDWQNIVVFGNLRKYAAKLKKGPAHELLHKAERQPATTETIRENDAETTAFAA